MMCAQSVCACVKELRTSGNVRHVHEYGWDNRKSSDRELR